MKRLTILVVAFVIGSIIAETCMARGRWRRRRTRTTYSVSYGGTSAMYSGTDQERAYAEAKYMHEHGIRAHVGGQIGNYEGWGWGGPNCSTCVPNRAMTLTADAFYGSIRVRAWR